MQSANKQQKALFFWAKNVQKKINGLSSWSPALSDHDKFSIQQITLIAHCYEHVQHCARPRQMITNLFTSIIYTKYLLFLVWDILFYQIYTTFVSQIVWYDMCYVLSMALIYWWGRRRSLILYLNRFDLTLVKYVKRKVVAIIF